MYTLSYAQYIKSIDCTWAVYFSLEYIGVGKEYASIICFTVDTDTEAQRISLLVSGTQESQYSAESEPSGSGLTRAYTHLHVCFRDSVYVAVAREKQKVV